MKIVEGLRMAGWRYELYDGDYGIEIETETEKEYRVPSLKFWNSHRDGSLRQFGIEYVLRQPVSFGDQLQDALDEFYKNTKKIEFIDSPYTSVHVHINMLHEAPISLANFLTLYTLFENILTKYSGPERESNLFCLPIKDAEGCLDIILNIVKHIGKRNWGRVSVSEDVAKYSALNLATLARIGTVEIRTFRGSSDIKEILKWVSIINKIREFSRRNIDPLDIVTLAVDDKLTLFNTVFGDLVEELNFPDVDQRIERNLLYAARIATAVKSWKDFGVPSPKKITAELYKANLDAHAQAMFRLNYNQLSGVQRLLVQEEFENANNFEVVQAEGDF